MADFSLLWCDVLCKHTEIDLLADLVLSGTPIFYVSYTIKIVKHIET